MAHDGANLGFPQKWVDSAIPYGQLKKCLKKVINELRELGLDKDTLAQLAASQCSDDEPNGTHHGFQYNLDEEPSTTRHLRPRLTVFVHLRNGVAVDATLSPATREFLGKIAAEKSESSSVEESPDETSSLHASTESSSDDEGSPSPPDMTPVPGEPEHLSSIEVPLVFDGEFFDMLQSDVSNLDVLQSEEQQKMKEEISALGKALTKITIPSHGRRAKDDMERWREIFELYLDARIFFSTRESDHGARSSAQALKQLQWFQEQVLKRKLVHGLKLRASREVFNSFISVNSLLLQNLKFQEINRLAVTKILKSKCPQDPVLWPGPEPAPTFRPWLEC